MTTISTKEAGQGVLAAAGVTKTYSTKEAAGLFGKSDQWVYWVLRQDITDENGQPFDIKRVGRGEHRRYTLDVIQKIGIALYSRGTLKKDGLTKLLTAIEQERRS
ncbi:hypothetical protein [Rhodococcus sp. NPDC049939]|uniref:DUF7229 domain-containing protein n=1 Tax=Rhodococcus sp. NPDC049939 TaxID=3155511 RepID=UPI00340DA23A